MDSNALVLSQMIEICDSEKLRYLLEGYGFPRQPITPELLEQVYRLRGDPFMQDFSLLVKEGLALRENQNRADGWTPTDWTKLLEAGSGLVVGSLSAIGIDAGKKKYEAEAAMWNAQATQAAAQAQANSSPWPWLIGGVVVVVLIIVIVMANKK